MCRRILPRAGKSSYFLRQKSVLKSIIFVSLRLKRFCALVCFVESPDPPVDQIAKVQRAWEEKRRAESFKEWQKNRRPEDIEAERIYKEERRAEELKWKRIRRSDRIFRAKRISKHVLFSLVLGSIFFIPVLILASLALNETFFVLDRFYVIVGWFVLYAASCVVASDIIHYSGQDVTWKFDEEGYLNRIERIRAIQLPTDRPGKDHN